MPPVETIEAAGTVAVAPSAVVWIDERRAIVVTLSRDGRCSTCETDRDLESELAYLARVVHAIGDRDRVMIIGPNSARLALEREYVALARRPERIVDVDSAGPADTDDLIRRLYLLAA